MLQITKPTCTKTCTRNNRVLSDDVQDGPRLPGADPDVEAICLVLNSSEPGQTFTRRCTGSDGEPGAGLPHMSCASDHHRPGTTQYLALRTNTRQPRPRALTDANVLLFRDGVAKTSTSIPSVWLSHGRNPGSAAVIAASMNKSSSSSHPAKCYQKNNGLVSKSSRCTENAEPVRSAS